jgi:hypothetical protein
MKLARTEEPASIDHFSPIGQIVVSVHLNTINHTTLEIG